MHVSLLFANGWLPPRDSNPDMLIQSQGWRFRRIPAVALSFQGIPFFSVIYPPPYDSGCMRMIVHDTAGKWVKKK